MMRADRTYASGTLELWVLKKLSLFNQKPTQAWLSAAAGRADPERSERSGKPRPPGRVKPHPFAGSGLPMIEGLAERAAHTKPEWIRVTP